jgi:hypothetical protein
MKRSPKKVKGLLQQPQSKNWYPKVKGVVQTTGTPDFTEAKLILDIRRGQAAKGEPLFRRMD